jgi:hypothetical protein
VFTAFGVRILVPGASLGVEGAVVALFSEKEEARDLSLFLGGEGQRTGNFIVLERRETVG